MWALRADGSRLPEALLVLLGLADRRSEAAAAERRQRGRRDRRPSPPRVSVHRPGRRQFLSGHARGPGDGGARSDNAARLEQLEALRAERFELMARLAQLPTTWCSSRRSPWRRRKTRSSSTPCARRNIKGALVGVEAVTPEGLKDVYKDFNDAGDALVDRLRTFREHGVYVLGSFIFGLPSDRPATFDGDGRCRRTGRPRLCAVRHADAVSRNGRFRRHGRRMWGRSAERVGGIPITRHWLIPQAQRPKVYAPHPVMSADEIRARTQAVWDRFYSLPQDLGALALYADAPRPPGVRPHLEAVSSDVRQHRHRHRQRPGQPGEPLGSTDRAPVPPPVRRAAAAGAGEVRSQIVTTALGRMTERHRTSPLRGPWIRSPTEIPR